MWLSEISIRRPVLAIVLSTVLVLFGLVGLSRLSVREYPDIDPPVVSVNTFYTGASPEVIENSVTETLEEEIISIEGIKTLVSKSGEGFSNIIVEFELDRDINVAAQDVRDRVFRARGRLPDGIEEPVIYKQDSDAQPILWLVLSGDRYSQLQLSDYGRRFVLDQLQTLPGVGRVIIGGEREYAMRLWLEPAQMAAHGVAVSDVQKALAEQSVELPSGRVEGLLREFTIRTMGELKTPEGFNRLVVKTVNGQPVYLRDIGRAEIGARDDRSLLRMNGKTAVGFGIVKQSKANTLDVADAAKAAMATISRTLPPGMSMGVAYDSSRFIAQSLNEVKESLLLSIVLVVVVIFLFLGSFRSTLIPAIAIPVSLIATFFVMYGLGYSINTLTLLAMTLAIGLVVDDAIVVLETIVRHIEDGEPPMQAAVRGIREIAFAVIATTLVLVAIFVPIAFMTGAVGRLFSEFAIALAGSVLISGFVSLSLSPMMCARLLRAQHSDTRFHRLTQGFRDGVEATRRGYLGALDWAMAHRGLILFGAGLSLVLTMLCYVLIPKEFLPKEDRGFILTFIKAPEGASLAYTNQAALQAEAVFRRTPDVLRATTVLAFGRDTIGAVNEGIMFVTLKDKEHGERTRSSDAILQEIMPQMMGIAEAFVFPITPPSGPTSVGADPIQLVLQGYDLQELARASAAMEAEAQKIFGLYKVESNLKLNKPELRLDIDRERASALGVSVRDISQTLQVLMGGLDLSTFEINKKRYKVMVQAPKDARRSPQDLEKLYVLGRDDQLVPLANAVVARETVAPKDINHYGRLRSATISAGLLPIPGVSMGTVMDQLEAAAQRVLPPGMRIAWTGESREMRLASSATTFAFVLAMLVVFLVLAAQFESFLDPLIVMLTVPLAVSGAFLTLYLFGASFNTYSQIGMILLVGLVTKNGILIVEYANTIRAANPAHSAAQAVVEACTIRFRPIVMTAIATIFGAVPLALGLGAGAQSRQSLGLSVIGGMALATILTLFVIPVVYALLKQTKRP